MGFLRTLEKECFHGFLVNWTEFFESARFEDLVPSGLEAILLEKEKKKEVFLAFKHSFESPEELNGIVSAIVNFPRNLEAAKGSQNRRGYGITSLFSPISNILSFGYGSGAEKKQKKIEPDTIIIDLSHAFAIYQELLASVHKQLQVNAFLPIDTLKSLPPLKNLSYQSVEVLVNCLFFNYSNDSMGKVKKIATISLSSGFKCIEHNQKKFICSFYLKEEEIQYEKTLYSLDQNLKHIDSRLESIRQRVIECQLKAKEAVCEKKTKAAKSYLKWKKLLESQEDQLELKKMTLEKARFDMGNTRDTNGMADCLKMVNRFLSENLEYFSFISWNNKESQS